MEEAAKFAVQDLQLYESLDQGAPRASRGCLPMPPMSMLPLPQAFGRPGWHSSLSARRSAQS